MKLTYHPKFVKQYKKLPTQVKSLLKKKGDVFVNDPFDKHLRTHKLNGKFEDFYAFSINYEYRIIFKFVNDNEVQFYRIGTHEIYS